MITGGTGSFGNTVLKHFLETDIGQIRIFSRDEKKQDDMRHILQAKHPEAAKKVKFYVGDVRDLRSVADAMYCTPRLTPVSREWCAFQRIRRLTRSTRWVFPRR